MRDELKKFNEATDAGKKLYSAVFGKSISDLQRECDQELLFDEYEKSPESINGEFEFIDDKLIITFDYTIPSTDPRNPWKYTRETRTVTFTKDEYINNMRLFHLLSYWHMSLNQLFIGRSDFEFVEELKKRMIRQ